jgi:hypothetical protein
MDESSKINNRIRRAFVRLDALRKNLPETHYVSEQYVTKYREALKHLRDVGFDVAEFDIPDSWVQQRVVASGPMATRYGKDREITRSQFRTKLDAAMGYFTFSAEESVPVSRRPSIGFVGPKQK